MARRIIVEIDRIVLDGVALNAADVEVMRTAIADELAGWLSGVDAETLREGATPRIAHPREITASANDGRALGRSVAEAVWAAVAPEAPVGAPLGGLRQSVGAPLRGARPFGGRHP